MAFGLRQQFPRASAHTSVQKFDCPLEAMEKVFTDIFHNLLPFPRYVSYWVKNSRAGHKYPHEINAISNPLTILN